MQFKGYGSGLVTLAALLCFFQLSARGEELSIGDRAPALEIAKWVKGDAVDLEKVLGKKLLVVEFWATWCPPCLRSIPHLTEIQKEHADDIVVVGVTKPDDRNPLDKVETFVSQMGDKMAYTVAFDGDKKTYASYMTASGSRGIPTSFIIDKEGRIAWIGHPMSMDEPLEKILAGTFDRELAGLVHTMSARYSRLYRKGDLEGALAALEAMVALDRSNTMSQYRRVSMLARLKRYDEAAKAAATTAEALKDGESLLNSLAWLIVSRPEFKPEHHTIGLEIAKRAVLSDSPTWNSVDTLALAYLKAGDVSKAIREASRALEMAKLAKARDTSITQLEARLADYKARAENAE